MLKVFRENLKYLSWVLWLVIAVFVLFVFVDFGATVPGGTVASDAAATVGRHKVSYSEFERSYRQAEDFYRQTYGEQFNRELAQQLGLPMQVLNGLIADKILLAEAGRMGLQVTSQELARAIADLPAFQLPDGRFIGQDRYSQILRSNGYTVDQFEAAMRSDLLSDKIRSVLSENLFVSEQEVKEGYKSRVETASIRYLRLPGDRLRDTVTIDDADLESYFTTHREEFRIAERRVVDYLLLDPDDQRATIDIPESELRQFYDANPEEFAQQERVRARHILLKVDGQRTAEAAETKLQEIRQRAESGEDFAALASELSEDPGSKAQGGDLGYFGRGQMIREFEEAAFAAQPGELVGPIRTSFGYHLIQVLDVQSPGQRAFEDVRESIRTRLTAERARSVAEAKARELADRLRRQKIDSADELQSLAGSESGVTHHSTPPFGRGDSVPGIGRATPFTQVAFTLGEGELSEPVQVTGGWAILRLREIREPRLPELSEVREEVREALLDERQLQLALDRLEEVRLRLEAGDSLEEVAAELDLSIDESAELRRLEPVAGLGMSPEITAAALALEEGDVGGPLAHQGDAVLFEVTQRQHYDPAEFETQKEQVRETLRLERVDQMLSSLISQRRDQLGVKYDTQLLRNFELVPGES